MSRIIEMLRSSEELDSNLDCVTILNMFDPLWTILRLCAEFYAPVSDSWNIWPKKNGMVTDF